MPIKEKSVETLDKLFKKKLSIPSYQRPYKWSTKHVGQLIDDVIKHQNKSAYRIGTVVLYQEKLSSQLEIVDGQQRLITVSLILHCLNKDINPDNNIGLLDHEFANDISFRNITNNYAIIEQKLRTLTKDEKITLR